MGKKGFLQFWVFNIEGKVVFVNSFNDVFVIFQQVCFKGVVLIDFGCMQINYYFYGEVFILFVQMLELVCNVEYVVKFLVEFYVCYEIWIMVVVCYYVGFNNDFVQK